MARAVKFYETVFNISLQVQEVGGLTMAFFPFDGEKKGVTSGALVKNDPFYTPSNHERMLVYLESLAGDLAVELVKIENAGGKVLQDKKLINESVRYMALFIDSEGNRMALYNL